jgi:hypothetical protein
VYLHVADTCSGSGRSHLNRVNQPVIGSHMGVSEPREAFCVRLGTDLASASSQSPPLPAAYSACGCGHGGTRNMSLSRSIHIWSVNPAAVAGVCDRHCLARPLPKGHDPRNIKQAQHQGVLSTRPIRLGRCAKPQPVQPFPQRYAAQTAKTREPDYPPVCSLSRSDETPPRLSNAARVPQPPVLPA